MTRNRLFYNGKIYTQVDALSGHQLIADSLAIAGTTIMAVGKNLERDDDFKSYERINFKGRAVLPGFTDAHTHFLFLALILGDAKLDGLSSLEKVLGVIKKHSRKLDKNEWVIGGGISPDRWDDYMVPDRYMLDKVTGGRPAAVFSKDLHMMWVNSRALEIAGINHRTKNPVGGVIERLKNNEPSGILKEEPAFSLVDNQIERWQGDRTEKSFSFARRMAYKNGVTGVHSFDEMPESLDFLLKLSRAGKLGLRVNYYPPLDLLPELKKRKIIFGFGNDYFRISGIKIFADGALGSQSALCFNKYSGSKDNFGVKVSSKKRILATIRSAAKLNLPCAIHAIGDRANANVLDCFEKAPPLKGNARHRIEHVQMIRRKDAARLKRLGITASMQPSHCPSDIRLIEKYWGERGRNCYIFKTLVNRGIHLAFGSDAPIEPLDPIAGIDAAVNRKAPGSEKAFYPEQRLTVSQAVYNFTAEPAYAVGQEFERGYLLPGYKADFSILSEDIYKVPKSKIKDVLVAETWFDGKRVYTL